MKKYLPYILLGLVLFAGGFFWANTRGKAALLNERIKNKMETVTVLADQIKDQAALIARGEAALAKHDADTAAREKIFQSVLTQVSHATPAQLVDQGSAILGVTDITTDGKMVWMSVETYRKAVAIFADWNEYKTVREPAWLNARGLLNDQIAGFKQERLLDAQKDAALAASITDLKKFISAQKTSTFFEKVLWAGAGVGVGMLVNKVMK